MDDDKFFSFEESKHSPRQSRQSDFSGRRASSSLKHERPSNLFDLEKIPTPKNILVEDFKAS